MSVWKCALHSSWVAKVELAIWLEAERESVMSLKQRVDGLESDACPQFAKCSVLRGQCGKVYIVLVRVSTGGHICIAERIKSCLMLSTQTRWRGPDFAAPRLFALNLFQPPSSVSVLLTKSITLHYKADAPLADKSVDWLGGRRL